MRIKRKCNWCKKVIWTTTARLRDNRGKFCSRTCLFSWKSKNIVGKKHHNWKGRFKKACEGCGKIFYVNFGRSKKARFCKDECRLAWFSHHRDGLYPDWLVAKYGKDHPGWKGDGAGYNAIHQWIRRQMGSPSFCAHCGTKTAKKFEWANISKQYLRRLGDWIRLCSSCHQRFDRSRPKQTRFRLK